MLTIRQEQLAVFSQAEVQKFEDWVLVHLKKFFPGECAAAGDQRLREMIQHGITRSSAYRITSRRDVAKYVDLMIVFGRDFDVDRRLPWAARILRRKTDSGLRMQELLRAAKANLKRR